MTKSHAKIPILKEVVVPGKTLLESEQPVPVVMTDEQMQRLAQEIEGIIQAKLNAALKNASQAVIKEIKAHLDNVLPALIKSVLEEQASNTKEDAQT